MGLAVAASVAQSAYQSEYDQKRDERFRKAREERMEKQRREADEKNKQNAQNASEIDHDAERADQAMWKNRYGELARIYHDQFKGKSIGDDVEIQMADGPAMHGKLTGIGSTTVVIQSGADIQSIDCKSMSDVSKQIFFADEYAKARALVAVAKERRDRKLEMAKEAEKQKTDTNQ